MTTTNSLDLGRQAAAVARVVAAVGDDQLGAPTPCGDLTVAALLDHLHGLAVGMRLAADKTPDDDPPYPAADALPADWRTRIPRELDELVAAWRRPGAWAGDTRAGAVELPAAVIGVVALNEVLVHGWDLAAAIGVPYEVDDAAVARCLEHARWLATELPGARDEIYGPVVDVPADAAPFDRLLGQTGRDPAWTPSS